jgi:hypothetical protein
MKVRPVDGLVEASGQTEGDDLYTPAWQLLPLRTSLACVVMTCVVQMCVCVCVCVCVRECVTWSAWEERQTRGLSGCGVMHKSPPRHLGGLCC